jgi:uncharacterized membrane protein
VTDFTQRIGTATDAAGRQARESLGHGHVRDSGRSRRQRDRMTAADPASKRIVNPALIEHARQRRESVENRIADHITEFSGSMRFVYLHAVWFACWIGFGVEAYPYGLLTMIVSLEAIFLSTFVMISQNRADTKREVLANQEWATVQGEDRQNQELLRLSRQILELTKAVHAYATAHSNDAAPDPDSARAG